MHYLLQKQQLKKELFAGGGTAFVDIIPNVAKEVEKLSGDEKIGGKIILRALEEPARQIASNCRTRASSYHRKSKTK